MNDKQSKFLKDLVILNPAAKTKAPSPSHQRESNVIREESHEMIGQLLDGNDICFKTLDRKFQELSEQPSM